MSDSKNNLAEYIIQQARIVGNSAKGTNVYKLATMLIDAERALTAANARIAELEKERDTWLSDVALDRAAKAVRYILDTDDPEGADKLERRLAKAAIDAARGVK